MVSWTPPPVPPRDGLTDVIREVRVSRYAKKPDFDDKTSFFPTTLTEQLILGLPVCPVYDGTSQ